MYSLSELARIRANRSKARVEQILGFPQPRNPKVRGVEVTASAEGKPLVVVQVTDAIAGPVPVLPKTVEGIDVIVEKCGFTGKTAHYRSNRQKMVIAVRRIANDLAAKFNKKPSLSWPLSFKLSTKLTVTVAGETGEDDESFRVIVKALAGLDMQPPFKADMSVTQMSTSQQTSDFIKRCEEGLKDLAPTIYMG